MITIPPRQKHCGSRHRLFEEAERLGDLEISIEVHRDTCTETPEKTYALADAFYANTGKLLPITWDFSHFAVVKHLQPKDFSSRLLERKELVTRARQFHFRPFNGHHCQVPVTQAIGTIGTFTPEFMAWLPFVEDVLSLWLDSNGHTTHEIFIVPEMGPTSSGYNLHGLPNSWEDTATLRPILEKLWHKVTQANRTGKCPIDSFRESQTLIFSPEKIAQDLHHEFVICPLRHPDTVTLPSIPTLAALNGKDPPCAA